eukprot:gene8550-5996_t
MPPLHCYDSITIRGWDHPSIWVADTSPLPFSCGLPQKVRALLPAYSALDEGDVPATAPVALIGAVARTIEVFDVIWGPTAASLSAPEGLRSRGHALDLAAEVLCLAAIQHQCVVVYTCDMELLVARYQANLPDLPHSARASDGYGPSPPAAHWSLLHRTRQLLPPIRSHTFLFPQCDAPAFDAARPPHMPPHQHPHDSTVITSNTPTECCDPLTGGLYEGPCTCCSPLANPVVVSEPDGRAAHAVLYPGLCHTTSFYNNNSCHAPQDSAAGPDRLPSESSHRRRTHGGQKWAWRTEAQNSSSAEGGGHWKPVGDRRWRCPPSSTPSQRRTAVQRPFLAGSAGAAPASQRFHASTAAERTDLYRRWCDGLPHDLTRGGTVDVEHDDIHALYLHQQELLKAALRRESADDATGDSDSSDGGSVESAPLSDTSEASVASFGAAQRRRGALTRLQRELEGDALRRWLAGELIDAPDQFLLVRVGMDVLEQRKQELPDRLKSQQQYWIEARAAALNRLDAVPPPVLLEAIELQSAQCQWPPGVACYRPYCTAQPRCAPAPSSFGSPAGAAGSGASAQMQLTISSTHVVWSASTSHPRRMQESQPRPAVALALPTELVEFIHVMAREDAHAAGAPPAPFPVPDDDSDAGEGFRFDLGTCGHNALAIRPRRLAHVVCCPNEGAAVPVAAVLLLPAPLGRDTHWMTSVELWILRDGGTLAAAANPFHWPGREAAEWEPVALAGVPTAFTPSRIIALDALESVSGSDTAARRPTSAYQTSWTHRYALLLDGLGEGYVVDLVQRCAVCSTTPRDTLAMEEKDPESLRGSTGPLMHVTKAPGGRVWASYAKGALQLLAPSVGLCDEAVSFPLAGLGDERVQRLMPLVMTDERAAEDAKDLYIAVSTAGRTALYWLRQELHKEEGQISSGTRTTSPLGAKAQEPQALADAAPQGADDHLQPPPYRSAEPQPAASPAEPTASNTARLVRRTTRRRVLRADPVPPRGGPPALDYVSQEASLDVAVVSNGPGAALLVAQCTATELVLLAPGRSRSAVRLTDLLGPVTPLRAVLLPAAAPNGPLRTLLSADGDAFLLRTPWPYVDVATEVEWQLSAAAPPTRPCGADAGDEALRSSSVQLARSERGECAVVVLVTRWGGAVDAFVLQGAMAAAHRLLPAPADYSGRIIQLAPLAELCDKGGTLWWRAHHADGTLSWLTGAPYNGQPARSWRLTPALRPTSGAPLLALPRAASASCGAAGAAALRRFHGVLIPPEGGGAVQLFRVRPRVKEVVCECVVSAHCSAEGMEGPPWEHAELATLPGGGEQWLVLCRAGKLVVSPVASGLQQHILRGCPRSASERCSGGSSEAAPRPRATPDQLCTAARPVRGVYLPRLLGTAGLPLSPSAILLSAEFLAKSQLLLAAIDRGDDGALLVTLDPDTLQLRDALELPSEVPVLLRPLPDASWRDTAVVAQTSVDTVLLGTAPRRAEAPGRILLLQPSPLRVIHSAAPVAADELESGPSGPSGPSGGVTDLAVGEWPAVGAETPATYVVAVASGSTLSLFRLLDGRLLLLAHVQVGELLTSVAVSFPYVCAAVGDRSIVYELASGGAADPNEPECGSNPTLHHSPQPLGPYRLWLRHQALEAARLGAEIHSQVALLPPLPPPAPGGTFPYHRFAHVDGHGNLIVRLVHPPPGRPTSELAGTAVPPEVEAAVAGGDECLVLTLLSACRLPAEPTKVIELHTFEAPTVLPTMEEVEASPAEGWRMIMVRRAPQLADSLAGWWWSPVERRMPRRLRWCERDVWLPSAAPTSAGCDAAPPFRQCLFVPCRDGSLFTAVALPHALGPLLSRVEAAVGGQHGSAITLEEGPANRQVTHLVPYAARTAVRQLFPSAPPHYRAISKCGAVFLDTAAEAFRLWHRAGIEIGALPPMPLPGQQFPSEGSRCPAIARLPGGVTLEYTSQEIASGDSAADQPSGAGAPPEGDELVALVALRRRAVQLHHRIQVQLLDETLKELSLWGLQEALYPL